MNICTTETQNAHQEAPMSVLHDPAFAMSAMSVILSQVELETSHLQEI